MMIICVCDNPEEHFEVNVDIFKWNPIYSLSRVLQADIKLFSKDYLKIYFP